MNSFFASHQLFMSGWKKIRHSQSPRQSKPNCQISRKGKRPVFWIGPLENIGLLLMWWTDWKKNRRKILKPSENPIPYKERNNKSLHGGLTFSSPIHIQCILVPTKIAKGRKKAGEKSTVAEREPKETPLPFPWIIKQICAGNAFPCCGNGAQHLFLWPDTGVGGSCSYTAGCWLFSGNSGLGSQIMLMRILTFLSGLGHCILYSFYPGVLLFHNRGFFCNSLPNGSSVLYKRHIKRKYIHMPIFNLCLFIQGNCFDSWKIG